MPVGFFICKISEWFVLVGGVHSNASLVCSKDVFNPGNRPVQVLLLNHERRGQSGSPFHGFLCTRGLFLLVSHIFACRYGQLQTDKKAAAAYFFNNRVLDGAQLVFKIRTKLERPLCEFFSSSTSREAMDTAQASGLPPNVEPWEPGVNTPRIS